MALAWELWSRFQRLFRQELLPYTPALTCLQTKGQINYLGSPGYRQVIALLVKHKGFNEQLVSKWQLLESLISLSGTNLINHLGKADVDGFASLKILWETKGKGLSL